MKKFYSDPTVRFIGMEINDIITASNSSEDGINIEAVFNEIGGNLDKVSY